MAGTVPVAPESPAVETFDVAVIGAGVHGCAAAAYLAERGARTVVIDRGPVAGGPTGRSSAMCRAYYTNPFLARVAREGLDILADFPEWSGGATSGFRRTGALFLHAPDDGDQLRETVPALAAIGTRVELLEPAAIEAFHPGFDLDGVGFGAWEFDAGPADPVLTTTGLWEMAKRRGAIGRLYEAVRTIRPRAGGGAVLHCERGDLEAARVLLAAGPWTRPLASQVGVDLPLTVERHYVTTNSWGDAAPLPFALADIPNGYYLIPEREALFGLGQLTDEPEVDPDHFHEGVTTEEQERMATAAMRRLPALAAAGAVGGWASLYDVSPDWQPVIGEIAPGIVVDAGTSGHGFKLAPSLGRYVAELVLDGYSDPGLDQFHPDRFAAGNPLTGGFGDAPILG